MSNPSIQETNFNFEDLSQKTIHFKNLGNVGDIFKLLHQLIDDEKDIIKKEVNKVIIKVKFNTDEEVSFEILAKNISLDNNLYNLSESLKEINKNNIITKAEFKKELLEKVYPIVSYYWSSSNTYPSEIFGDSWTKLEGNSYLLRILIMMLVILEEKKNIFLLLMKFLLISMYIISITERVILFII